MSLLHTELKQLQLEVNSFSGTIPTQVGQLAELWWLHLYDNSLSGVIPTEPMSVVAP